MSNAKRHSAIHRLKGFFASEDTARGILIALAAGSFISAIIAIAAADSLENPSCIDLGMSLIFYCGLLAGVCWGRIERFNIIAKKSSSRKQRREEPESSASQLRADPLHGYRLGIVCIVGLASLAGASLLSAEQPIAKFTLFVLAALMFGAWLSFTVSTFFSLATSDVKNEFEGLAKGAKIVAWIFIITAAALISACVGAPGIATSLHRFLLLFNCALCLDLYFIRGNEAVASFPTNLKTFDILGSKNNPIASALDTAQQRLGIDLRSTWAITLVRRSLEPLLVLSVLLAWLATSLTVVDISEVGIVEHYGVKAASEPLEPGIHLHWPWPVDTVSLLPSGRIQTLHIGHESSEEEEGPEDILWARRHSDSEYTLLLGNGRDLIAIDAAVQYRISDPVAWRYQSQNPEDALRAIAYRAVMKSTVNRTLTDTLSENVATLTAEMKRMVQADADALRLGVQVMSFTIGGMHPPVDVAADYQAVVSADLERVTAAVNARADANTRVPIARADVLSKIASSEAGGIEEKAVAEGEAKNFKILEEQYHQAPEEYRFRSRLEALEAALADRPFVILDERIERDGGELWITK